MMTTYWLPDDDDLLRPVATTSPPTVVPSCHPHCAIDPTPLFVTKRAATNVRHISSHFTLKGLDGIKIL